MPDLYFCLFSYNRAKFLENCVKSIESCSPSSPIMVFDDESTDPATIAVIEKLRTKHTVIQPSELDKNKFSQLNNQSKFGGLYNNMQLAIELLPDNQLFCFIQDDMQCVRKVHKEEISHINSLFDNYDIGFLHQSFLKASNRERDELSTYWHEEHGVYYRDNPKQSAGIFFSAIFISRTDVLQKHNWSFENREKINGYKAQKRFGKMAFMKNPFCLWLPGCPVYRGKKKTLAIRIAEYLSPPGFHPIKILDDKEARVFETRANKSLPFAEDFLTLERSQFKKPWTYSSLQGRSLLKSLNRFEIYFKMVYINIKSSLK